MTFGKFGTDREERINYERMREYRLARTREQMEKAGLGALITWEPWNVRYIAVVVRFRDGDSDGGSRHLWIETHRGRSTIRQT